MAQLTGYNGLIMIDTNEANYDKQQVAQAQQLVQQVKQQLRPERLDDARFTGASKKALDDLLVQFKSQLDAADRACGDLQQYIARTVAHYEEIDKEIAARIARGY